MHASCLTYPGVVIKDIPRQVVSLLPKWLLCMSWASCPTSLRLVSHWGDPLSTYLGKFSDFSWEWSSSTYLGKLSMTSLTVLHQGNSSSMYPDKLSYSWECHPIGVTCQASCLTSLRVVSHCRESSSPYPGKLCDFSLEWSLSTYLGKLCNFS